MEKDVDDLLSGGGGGDDDDRGGERKVVKLLKGESIESVKNEKVVLVILRGSWSSGAHQELICVLESGKLIRISRTNAADTFQIGADSTHVDKEGIVHSMPELCSNKTHPSKQPFTVQHLYQVFRNTRRSMRFYSRGDCRDFAQSIYKDCTGYDPATGKFKSDSHSLEDSSEGF
ncbi:hypothetical protein [Acidicapsa acidisoli]|uniref:hypothetical protein n=1 Tax=Acidicapsa acidisoli TaxID=1615681 RepID=UPI0021DF9912|nr:hypothetical protein [Acidicapsa acidisoli]